MKGIFTSAAFVALLLCADAVTSVAARRNGTRTRSLARKRSGHHHKHKRGCHTKTPIPTPTPTLVPTETDPEPTATPTSAPAPGGGGSSAGVLQSDWKCDGMSSGATTEIGTTSGPNGDEDWLNCGLESGGWSPPPLTIDEIVRVDLEDALKDPDSPYHACENYLDIFNKVGNELGVPSIYIAAFALQESNCNPDITGGGGEQGMMQITSDKCVNPPNGNCKDPEYNIGVGARYFADQLKEHNGNVLETVGTYNGWWPGMTKDKVLSQSNPCWQQNMDYMMQFFNVWLQNKNAYGSKKYGKHHNYDACSGS
ncbi:lysozyme-like protein [Auricularia subglabra TFB-10046 SS5]|nr:lysozyme-like protein [Auricularia subglabra TFB-10046 SS5]